MVPPQASTPPVGMDNFGFMNIGVDAFPDWDWSAGLSLLDQSIHMPVQHFDQQIPMEFGTL